MRYIDADKLMIVLNDWWYSQTKIESQNIHYDDYISVTIRSAMEAVKEQPTADVRENVRGEWLSKNLDNFRKYEVICSVCGARFIGNYDAYDEPYDFNFCPNCGADMRGDNNEMDSMQ